MAKVSDFGLSLRIYQERVHNKKMFRFPIRWMAPEFLNHASSSEMSDVWSFGILLWEIFELALKQPYGVKGILLFYSFSIKKGGSRGPGFKFLPFLFWEIRFLVTAILLQSVHAHIAINSHLSSFSHKQMLNQLDKRPCVTDYRGQRNHRTYLESHWKWKLNAEKNNLQIV